MHCLHQQQATLLLQFPIQVTDADQEQLLILRYDTNNLVPGATSLKNPPLSTPPALLEGIARHGSPKIRTLLLVLSHPCSVWCLRSAASVVPGDYPQLIDLAKANEVYILFDYNYLHKDNHKPFRSIFSRPDELTAIPPERGGFADSYRLVDWSVPEATHEAPPPSYASSKHDRQVSTSPTRETRSPKRNRTAASSLLFSPNEKATTPSMTNPRPPASPVINMPGFQEAVERALKEVLSGTMPGCAPSVLTPRLEESTLSTLIYAHIDSQLHNIHAEVAGDAADLRCAADTEFYEELDEYKLEITMAKDDAIAELNRMCDEKLDKLGQMATDIVENTKERLDKLHAEACDKTDTIVEGHASSSKHNKAVLEIRRQMLDKKKAVLENRRDVLENEKAILENEEAILENKWAMLEKDMALNEEG